MRGGWTFFYSGFVSFVPGVVDEDDGVELDSEEDDGVLSLSDGGGVDCELSEEDSTGGIDSSVELLDSTISELLSGVDSGSEEELIVDLVLELGCW